ncbi:hypothetical protein [Sphingomonas sp.]|uniref:hypothetical protein n=1 Tax=Sphingomonas sp. TaxID=28214 RepID=UPI001B0AA5C1|nr:hypothetical protein [Sphingomonas sp.]MBO9711588.1 hypothetical protein [Sphingomonas sp.]
MDATTLAWAGVAATIIGGVLSGYVSRTDAFDRLLWHRKRVQFAGTTWESTWTEVDKNGNSVNLSETFIFKKQIGNRIAGMIEMSQYPDRIWYVEGDYNERFLRLFWTPSKESSDRFFLDYGVYFFERGGDGTFTGYATGFDAEQNRVIVVEHHLQLRRIN